MICEVHRLGTVPYDDGVRLQEERVAARLDGRVPDALFLLEHPHVVTLGRSADAANILWNESELQQRGVAVRETGRGGDVTYHGPGQLVGYPVILLERQDLHAYLRDLEETLIFALGDFGIAGGRVSGYTGVWIGDEKIAAIGVRVTRWVTSHGFALNVAPDLSYFGSIVPCGIRSGGVTSMARVLGRAPSMNEVAGRVAARFGEVFGREMTRA